MSEKSTNPSHGFSTEAVHGKLSERKTNSAHAIITPIHQTATYVFDDTDALRAFQDEKMWGGSNRVEYARYGNPSVRSVERRIAALENGGDALLFSSGMAAITNTLLSILPGGSHVIFTDDCYRKTRNFCTNFLRKFNITSSEVPMGDYEALENAIQENTRVIISESPTNPYMRVADLEKITAIAKKYKRVKTMIDATFATPINIRPLDFGIDIVIHSASKYFGGHNDLIAGVVIAEAGLIQALRMDQGMIGGITDPHTAFLIERGLKTLELRVNQQNKSGQAVAEFLENHPKIDRVHYAGLPSHPDYEIATAQMKGFGGVVSFEVTPIDGEELLVTACRMIDAMEIPLVGASLGGPETLIEPPSIMSYYELSTEERLQFGIRDNLIRLALGLENTEDLIADLTQALGKL